MNADAVAALPWGEYIAKLAATPCLAFREPWSCLNEPEEDGSPEAPMWERDELCPPCLVRAARAALAAAPLPSDTPPEPHPVLAKYGLETMEGDQLAILERHLTGNAAATIGAWKTTAEGWERRARAAESDTPADELDEEREISLVGAEELGHAVAETPWPPVESDAIGETVTGHGAVLLARLHRRGWALVPLAATLDHREQPASPSPDTQERPE